MSVILDDNTILASVDFSYQVKVKKAGAEVLHFSNEREAYSQRPLRYQYVPTAKGEDFRVVLMAFLN